MKRRLSKALNDVQLRAWVEQGRPVAKSDGDGLTFTVSANGTAAWVLRYRLGGRRKELTLGKYPDLTIKQARLDATAARLRVAQGIDVAAEKQRSKTAEKAAWTIREVVKDFEQKKLPEYAPGTAGNLRAYIERDLLPRFGAWVVRDIAPSDAQAWLENIARTRSFQAAANARRTAVAIGDHAQARHLIASNPFRAIKLATVARKPTTRARIQLSDAQLKVFLAGLSYLPEPEAIALRLLLITGCRANELFPAEWDQFDMDEGSWRIPREKIKTRASMRAEHFEILLPSLGVSLLERLRDLSTSSEWLFPSNQKKGPISYSLHVLRLRALLDKLDDFPTITHHDLRSTARSHWSALGVRTEVAERMLNHSLGGLLQVYDRNDFRDERRLALEQWAAKLESIERDDPKVVPIKRKSTR
jgi:integrase